MNKVSAESMLARMKTNHSSFELIPEEGEENIMQDNTVTAGAGFRKLSEPVTTTSSGATCQAPLTGAGAPSALTDSKGQPTQHSDNPATGSMAQAQQV